MFNVNVDERDLKELKEAGYYLENEKNMITIRNMSGRTIGEIIYCEESNTILLMSKREAYWLKKIDGIDTYFGEVYVLIKPVDGGIGRISLNRNDKD